METKQIPQGGKKAKWESRLLKDLLFIKKHGRYPISKQTVLPAGAGFLFILFMLRMAWPVFFVARQSAYVPILIGVVVLLGIVNILIRYTNFLRFRKLETPFHVTPNIELLQQFFRIQQLAFTQHPEAPEVFMIMSRALGGRDEQREVMIFIADEKRILVNSHFIDNKISFNTSSGPSKKMAQMLRNWIDKHIDKSNTTAVSLNKI